MAAFEDIEFRIAQLPTGTWVILYGKAKELRFVPVAFDSEEAAREELQRQIDIHNAKMKELVNVPGSGPPLGVFAKGPGDADPS